MFLKKEDLGNSIYEYQIDAITEGNDAIVLNAIAAAIAEVKSYLTGNNHKEWSDGRVVYDTDAIFNATDTNRHPLIVSHTIIIAKWWLVDLCNADVIYEQAKERYDRSSKYLRELSSGNVTIGDLPVLTPPTTETTTGPFISGSRAKFNHE